MLNKIKLIYQQEMFAPKLLGAFFNPYYFVRRDLIKHITQFAKRLNGSLLDVGCGTKPYRDMFNVTSYTGLEVESDRSDRVVDADIFYDGVKFPFNDNSFDSIFTSQVIEHVFDLDVFMTEVSRVIVKDGNLLLTVPFFWGEHEQPHDFARYTSFGLKHVLRKYGFEVKEVRKLGTPASVCTQILTEYVVSSKVFRHKVGFILATLLLIFPMNMICLVLEKLIKRNGDIYSDIIILATKVRSADEY